MSEVTPHSETGDLHAHDEAAHVAAHLKKYIMVGGVLMVGTLITVLLSYIDFGTQTRNIVIAMIVASIKVGFVAMVFMHLNAEKSTIYRLIFITLFLCFVLFALTGLAFFDPIHL